VNEQQTNTVDELRTLERDRRVLALYEQLLEIEQRLIPTGLHVFGRVPEKGARADMLRMVASFDRPEAGARALPDLVAEGLGLGPYETLLRAEGLTETQLRERERVDKMVSEAIELSILKGADEAARWLQTEARVPTPQSLPAFALLENISRQLESNHELDALSRALSGQYIEPGPGADIVQNPQILPTGRNTHAVNPYTVPSEIAYARAERVVNSLLERHRREHGRYPRAMALVLWGLDNIKTQGEGEIGRASCRERV